MNNAKRKKEDEKKTKTSWLYYLLIRYTIPMYGRIATYYIL